MSKAIRNLTKINLLVFTILIITPFLSSALVLGITDFDRPRTIEPGYDLAFTHTVENFKNQKFTIEIEFNETVPEDYVLNVFCTTRDEWDDMLEGSVSVNNMTHFLYNGSVIFGELFTYEVVIPDWEEWTFVFLNLNQNDMLTQIKLSHQHILWWLWIVLPGLVIIGLVAYGVIENVTKYERVRMDSDKAFAKLSSRSEGERKRAAYWLISNGEKEDLAILKDKLDDDKSIMRENAAFVIGGISRKIGDKSMSPILQKKYEVEADPLVKEEIVGALCDVASASAVPILIKYLLVDHNEHLRFRIAEALTEIASPKSVPALVETIEGENTDTLKMACNRVLEKIALNEGTDVEKIKTKYSK